MKVERKHPCFLLPIMIPEWKWEDISMDFITGFLRAPRNHDSVMVVVDRLSTVVHFILVKTTYSAIEVARVLIREILRLHVVLKKIVLNKDAKFTSVFWNDLFAGLGIDLAFCIAFHL